MERHDNDIDAVIRELSGGSCHRDAARQMADAFANCLGLTPAQYMKRWRAVFIARQERA
jgi:hypothetical protein